MKKLLMNRKNTIIAIAVTLAVMVIAIGTTMAFYQNQTATAVNTFAVGNVTTEIVEIFNKISDTEYQKEPRVTNTGENDCYIRMRVSVTPKEALDNLSIDFDTVNWTGKTGADGEEWYYYNNPVAPGESTTPLFTKVNVSYDEEEHPWIDFDIILYQEAVQSEVVRNGDTLTDSTAIWNLYDAKE